MCAIIFVVFAKLSNKLWKHEVEKCGNFCVQTYVVNFCRPGLTCICIITQFINPR